MFEGLAVNKIFPHWFCLCGLCAVENLTLKLEMWIKPNIVVEAGGRAWGQTASCI